MKPIIALLLTCLLFACSEQTEETQTQEFAPYEHAKSAAEEALEAAEQRNAELDAIADSQ